MKRYVVSTQKCLSKALQPKTYFPGEIRKIYVCSVFRNTVIMLKHVWNLLTSCLVCPQCNPCPAKPGYTLPLQTV